MKINRTLAAAVLLIATGVIGLAIVGSYGHWGGQSYMDWGTTKTTFSSNGERIYYTATNSSGDPIPSRMGGVEMTPSMMSCVDCHGEDGRGGVVHTRGMMGMMGSFEAPDIRYSTLTEEDGNDGHGDEHPPYTDELLKRAVTDGVNPAGERLEAPMPRWDMSEEDLEDLIEYLKTLE